MSDQEQLSGWAILELMGHRRLGGQLSVAEIGGASFIRIDIPGTADGTEATQFYSPSAVYAITPTTEQIARHVGMDSAMPVNRWDLRQIEAAVPDPYPDHGRLDAYAHGFNDGFDHAEKPEEDEWLRGDTPTEEEAAYGAES